MTEQQMKIVDTMAGLIGTSPDRLDTGAKEMIKLVSGILVALTTVAAYFKVSNGIVIAPMVLMLLGLVGFIVTVHPFQISFIVGEINSSEAAYKKMLRRKTISTNCGYAFTYAGFALYMLALLP